ATGEAGAAGASGGIRRLAQQRGGEPEGEVLLADTRRPFDQQGVVQRRAGGQYADEFSLVPGIFHRNWPQSAPIIDRIRSIACAASITRKRSGSAAACAR